MNRLVRHSLSAFEKKFGREGITHLSLTPHFEIGFPRLQWQTPRKLQAHEEPGPLLLGTVRLFVVSDTTQ